MKNNQTITLLMLFCIISVPFIFGTISCKSTAEVVEETTPEPEPDPEPASEPVAARSVTPPPTQQINVNDLAFSEEISGWGYKKWDRAGIQSILSKKGNSLAEKIRTVPSEYTIIVTGYADASGPEQPVAGEENDHPGNIEIGRRRAQAVVDYLVAQYDFPESRFSVRSEGGNSLKNPSNPKSPVNRRVVVSFEPPPEQ